MLQLTGWNRILIASLSLLLGTSWGCSSLFLQHKWPKPDLAYPDSELVNGEYNIRYGSLALANAETAYAEADIAREEGSESCVDDFFRAARYAWQDIESRVCKGGSAEGRSMEIYRSSLNALVDEGQRFNRFDPSSGLQVHTEEGAKKIPTAYFGFVRSPDDFNSLVTVGEYPTKKLNNTYRKNGLGVPTIVVRCRPNSDDFQRKQQPFPATLVLRPLADASSIDRDYVLEFYDPMRSVTIDLYDIKVPLARDISAPMARAVNLTQRNYVQSFLDPGSTTADGDGLFIIEPYQAGKIPVVFVHGLLSDRLTWANVVNEINARPHLREKYQIWGFEYPTGEGFLKSAAGLRQQLAQLKCLIDPQGTDEALRHVVLVGHSMGGLISKLQVTYSKDELWNAISNRPFQDVVMESESRERLAKSAFFEPSPMISRVVFIGTPHCGSGMANRTVGRLSSLLVKEPAETKESHRQLIGDNPDTFSREFSRRVPTSIDLLEPNSPLLAATNHLPTEPRVRFHSIIGHGRWSPGSGDSDGIVPVSSAKYPAAVTERLVYAKHTDLTNDPTVIEELLSILNLHSIED